MLRIFLAGLCLVMMQGVQAANINVVGLFPDAAVVLIDGQRHFIRAGQTVQGIKLVSADNTAAVLSVDGDTRSFGLGRETTQGFSQARKTVVKLIRNHDGHYYVNGKINGRAIRMLVDTGATTVSLSVATAEQLGIRYEDGEQRRYGTANGTITGYRISLPSVSVQGITYHNVDAAVLPNSGEVLLGMSFLNRTNMREENNILYLEPRY